MSRKKLMTFSLLRAGVKNSEVKGHFGNHQTFPETGWIEGLVGEGKVRSGKFSFYHEM